MGELRAGLEQWRNFVESAVWQDMKSELEEWLKDTWRLLEREDTDWGTTVMLRGRARAIREVLQLPGNMIAYLEELEAENGLER